MAFATYLSAAVGLAGLGVAGAALGPFLLMTGPLSNIALARFACGLLGGIALPLLLLSPETARQSLTLQTSLIALLFAATLAGELLECYLFFAAVASARMPGGPRP